MLIFVIITLEPSAKRTGTEILHKIVGKSLIYKRNGSGPKMDPCSTPCELLFYSEHTVL
jgi:hypothetical protein